MAIIVRSGLGQVTQTAGDPTNGHMFANDGKTFLEITNTDTVARRVTVKAGKGVGVDGLPIIDQVYNLNPGDVILAGDFARTTFDQNTDHDLFVDVTSPLVKFRVYRHA